MSIYTQLGVKRVINCVSTTTPLGSSVVPSEVMDTMTAASTHFVCMDDLQVKAGNRIARLTGTEAALVTSGCYGALTMASAACMMQGTVLENFDLSIDRPPVERGDWFTWMQRLPDDTAELKNEILLQRCHLNMYSQAHRVAGAQLVLAGTPEHCSSADIESHITRNTAAIAYVGMLSYRGLSLKAVLNIAHAHQIPVILDAAYTLPPRANLKHWAALGTDLICYSGGKAIRGPTDTGILCGRKDLVTLAAIQMSPHHGIGRGLKVDKTQIVGLLKALELFIAQNDEDEFTQLKRKATFIRRELQNIAGVQVNIVVPKTGYLRTRPVVTLTLDESRLEITTKTVVDHLFTGDPGIWTYYDHRLCPNGITMNTQNLLASEEEEVVRRFNEILSPR